MTNTPNPYVGPRSFQMNETLYGRDRELRQLTDRLISERIVLLHSPSGAGKTSLVQAGLIPQLGTEGFFVHPVIRVNLERRAGLVKITDTLKDVRRFNRYTFSTLLSLEERYPAEERVELPRLARLSLEEYLVFRYKEDKRDGPEFLIFDQFEEALTIDPTDRAAKNAFFSQLGAALKNRDRWALFVMRTDYVGALEPYVRLVPTYFSNTFHLELLGVKAALEAIQKPARRAGVNFTDGAASKLVDDLRRVQVQLLDGSMETQLGLNIEPVQLQVVCYRLWESKSADNLDIDEKDLASVGDVSQSLAEYYALSVSKVAEAASVTERSIREWFDRKLITPEGIRSQVRMGAEVSEGLSNEAVRRLEDAHIIRAEKRAGQTWYELAHDRLVEPVRADNKKWFDANLSLFQRQAALWLEQGRSEGLLLRGKELDMAEKQTKLIELTPDEVAFLEACRVQKQREKRDQNQRRIIFGALVVSVILFGVALFFSIVATNANQGFEAEARKAEAASTQAIAQQSTAQAASTQAISQQSTAQAASTQAIAQQSTAQAASTQAVANANAAATAQANAEAEKVKANEQEQIAREQKKLAQASELVAQSLLAQNKIEEDLANLLAVEAFNIVDNSRTRIQLLSSLSTKGRLFLVQTANSGTTSTIAFGSDHQSLVSSNFYNCEPDSKYYLCQEGVFKLWNIKSSAGQNGKLSAAISQAKTISSAGVLDAVAFSPDGKIVASAVCDPVNDNILRCEKEFIALWDAKTYARVGQDIPLENNVSNDKNVLLAYSPDGQILATAFNNSTIILLDMQTYAEKGRIQAGNGVSQMAFSPDGKTLGFASGNDRKITFVDVDSLETRAVPAEGGSRPILSLAFSPDGKKMALGSADGNILLWDAQTYQAAGQMFDRQSKILSLAFSPDGKILAAGHDNFYLTLWDVETRLPLVRPIFKHTNQVYSLAFSPDGKMLASVGEEIILWDLEPESWKNKACDIAARNFTQAEWQLYFPGEEYRLTCPQWPAGK